MSKKILLLGLIVIGLAGCATSSNYISYTPMQYPPKDPTALVNVYPESQRIPASNPYYLIGEVSVEGFASNGVTPDTLTRQAMQIARKRGADAIINAKTLLFRYYGGDALLRFKGALIVYLSSVPK